MLVKSSCIQYENLLVCKAIVTNLADTPVGEVLLQERTYLIARLTETLCQVCRHLCSYVRDIKD